MAGIRLDASFLSFPTPDFHAFRRRNSAPVSPARERFSATYASNDVETSPRISVRFRVYTLYTYSKCYDESSWNKFVSYLYNGFTYQLTVVHVPDVRITTVQFHVVDFPFGELLGVRGFVTHHARVTSARFFAPTLVQTEFQPFRVHLRDNNRCTRVSIFRGADMKRGGGALSKKRLKTNRYRWKMPTESRKFRKFFKTLTRLRLAHPFCFTEI